MQYFYEKGYRVTEASVLKKTIILSTSSQKYILRKGKVRTNVIYRGKNHEAYLSHVKVQITASRKDICLVLVYGITEHPMMLATNKGIRRKFQFENFRVRKLSATHDTFNAST